MALGWAPASTEALCTTSSVTASDGTLVAYFDDLVLDHCRTACENSLCAGTSTACTTAADCDANDDCRSYPGYVDFLTVASDGATVEWSESTDGGTLRYDDIDDWTADGALVDAANSRIRTAKKSRAPQKGAIAGSRTHITPSAAQAAAASAAGNCVFRIALEWTVTKCFLNVVLTRDCIASEERAELWGKQG